MAIHICRSDAPSLLRARQKLKQRYPPVRTRTATVAVAAPFDSGDLRFRCRFLEALYSLCMPLQNNRLLKMPPQFAR
jgi:hypothetical protein